MRERNGKVERRKRGETSRERVWVERVVLNSPNEFFNSCDRRERERERE